MQTIDLSHSRLTPQAAEAIRALGYTRCIVGIRYADIPLTANNLSVATQAGFEVESYAYLYWGGDVVDRVRRSIALVQPYGGRIYLDLEDNGDGTPGVPPASTFPPSRIVDLIGTALDACEDYPRAMYSGSWWWKPATDDWVQWAGEKWWTADYDGVPDLEVFTPYAGITQLHGKQHTGDAHLAGMVVDLSVFRE